MKSFKSIATASALILSSGLASAAVIGPSTPTGSEVLLSIVDNATNDSITIDLGKTIDQLVVGDVFSLGATGENFIASAGGLSNVSYGVIAGKTQDFINKQFLTSSLVDLTGKAVANATKGTWENSIIQLTGNLNASDASGPEVNNTYGPFGDDLSSPNYISGGHFNWQTGDSDLSTLALGDQSMGLYTYDLSGFGGVSNANAVLAPVELSETSLSIVPIPAAVWLFGSALLGMFGAGRREQLRGMVSGLFSRA